MCACMNAMQVRTRICYVHTLRGDFLVTWLRDRPNDLGIQRNQLRTGRLQAVPKTKQIGSAWTTVYTVGQQLKHPRRKGNVFFPCSTVSCNANMLVYDLNGN